MPSTGIGRLASRVLPRLGFRFGIPSRISLRRNFESEVGQEEADGDGLFHRRLIGRAERVGTAMPWMALALVLRPGAVSRFGIRDGRRWDLRPNVRGRPLAP